MMKSYLILCFLSASLLFSCDKNDMEADVEAFADLKCQIKDIDGRFASGELNYIENEDEKEPIFAEMDVIRRRYEYQVQEFDSLLEISLKDKDCLSWKIPEVELPDEDFDALYGLGGDSVAVDTAGGE